uniref:LPXTG cell wall anchor domain-containing protein n=1 Tax=candidate division CPR3 bacterium TaxID=2268181 RepID=A0A7V3N5R1_UNCC3
MAWILILLGLSALLLIWLLASRRRKREEGE